jgi:hypothetical protein
MNYANRIIRHWLGLAHGMLIMLAIAWGYEGKMSFSPGSDPCVLILVPAGIITGILLAYTIEALCKELDK